MSIVRPHSEFPTPEHVTGVVLAGGRSQRMGGGDKGLLDLQGRPMLAHVIERLQRQVAALVLNANGDPARFASLGLPVMSDSPAGYLGPLAGVLAGMRWAIRHTPAATHVVTVPGDAPLLPLDLVSRLAKAAEDGDRAIALASSPSGLHPVVGLWPVALAEDLDQALRDGVRKVRQWADNHGSIGVAFEALDVDATAIDPFYNANTPEDLARLRQILAKAPAL